MMPATRDVVRAARQHHNAFAAGDKAIFKETTLRERAWWMLRRHGSATLNELLSVLAAPSHRAAANNLAKYLRALKKAGFLKVEGGNAGDTKYVLLRNSGCGAPKWREAKGLVTDPNTAEVYVIGDAYA
jgi:hypothetical protein